MTKTLARLAAIALLAAGPAAAASAPAEAATRPVTYKNCTALNKAYQHGVRASARTVDRKAGVKKASKATVNAKLYHANQRLDRDRDGIACER